MATKAAAVPASRRARPPLGPFLLDALFPLFIALGLALWLVFTVGYSKTKSDFAQDYLAGYALRHHLPIYGRTIENLSVSLLGFWQYNAHPPSNALLFLPLSLLPYRAAFIVWNVIDLLALLFLLKTIQEEVRLPWNVARTLGAAVLVWPAFAANTSLGQVSVYTALGLIWTWRWLARGREWRAGVLLGAICVVKLFPLLFLAFFAVTRRWRAMAAGAATIVTAFAVSWLAVGSAPFVEYVTSIAPDDVRVWGGYPVNASIRGALTMLSSGGATPWSTTVLTESVGRAIAFAASGAVVAATMWMAYRAHRAGRSEEPAFQATTAAMLLASPLAWSHMFITLLWPGAALVADRSLSRAARIAACAAFVTLSLPEITLGQLAINQFLPNRVPWEAALLFKLPTAGLVTVWWILIRRAARGAAVTAPASV
jgi:hypothetical protein